MSRAALLDIDGTLLRAGDRAHVEALERAVSTVYGVAATLEGIVLGGNLDRSIASEAAVNAGVPTTAIEADIDAALDLAGRLYAAAIEGDARRTWLLPGVEAALDTLATAGVGVGIVSGNAEAIGWHKLGAAGIAEHFSFAAWGSERGARSELVERAVARGRARTETTVLIGDTPLDIEAASVAGVRCLAVATGRYGLDELASADETVGDLTDPSTLLDQLCAEGLRGQ